MRKRSYKIPNDTGNDQKCGTLLLGVRAVEAIIITRSDTKAPTGVWNQEIWR